jgi:DNA-binding transcriptional LysR family regulator
MEFRHLRCFIAVAEELHFARAAERLRIEQSPLSRAIKELEEGLGVKLFVRTTRSTRLTRAGKLFQEHVPRVFTALQQARDSVKAAANGFHGQLRVALSDGITPSRFSTFLALCRQEEPEIEIRLSEVSLAQHIKGLHDDLYDVGFAQSDEVGDGVIAEPVWDDPLMIAVPARHPLLNYKRMLCPTVFRARCPTPICACSMPFECPVSGAESRPPTGWFGSIAATLHRLVSARTGRSRTTASFPNRSTSFDHPVAPQAATMAHSAHASGSILRIKLSRSNGLYGFVR